MSRLHALTLHRPVGVALALAAAMALAACSTPFRPPKFAARDGGSTDFPGIAQLVADAPSQTLDVLLVHGMCTHDGEWATHAIGRLDRQLGGSGTPAVSEHAVPDTKITLYRATLAGPGGTVRANALLWSPIVTPLKQQLCFDQTEKSARCRSARPVAPAYPYQRAALNADLKDGLLDDCLADVLVYQGRSRKAISEQIQLAILATASEANLDGKAAARAAAAAQRGLVIVTESLGSKITFDAIHALIFNPQEDEAMQTAGKQTLARTVQIFMAANQLPMLALADQTLPGTPQPRSAEYEFPKDPLAALMQMMKNTIKSKGAASLGDSTPQVIAFTDPNDLLSWILVPSTQAGDYAVVDVVVSNAPTLLGQFESPDAAHRDYLTNDDVIKLITHGHGQSAQ